MVLPDGAFSVEYGVLVVGVDLVVHFYVAEGSDEVGWGIFGDVD